MRSALTSGRYRGPFAAVAVLAVVCAGFSGCNQSPEVKTARYLEKGKALLQKRDFARAILEFRNATRLAPRNPDAFYNLGVALLNAGDITGGLGALRKAVQLNPKHADAQLALARIMMAADGPAFIEDARNRLDQLVRDNPANFNAVQALGLAEWKLGDREAGLKNLERAAAAAPKELVLAATLAEAKLEQKDVSGAEEILKKACAATNSPAAYVILGRLYASQARLPEAEAQYRRALSLDAKFGPGLYNLALLQRSTGKAQDAEQTFRQLSELPDTNLDYLYAAYLFSNGQRDKAVQEFERLAKKYPGDRPTRTRLVSAYLAVNRPADAESLLNAALKKNPSDVDALVQRGWFYLRIGKLSEAETDLNQARKLQPDVADLHLALAEVHRARGMSSLEQQELAEALKYNPDLLSARVNLARALITGNSPQAALDILNQAPPSQLEDASIREARNWAYLALNKFADARRGVDAALQGSRTSILLLQDAVLKLMAKDYAGARASASESFRKDPSDPRALRIIAQTYTNEKRMDEAIKHVRELAAAAPQSASAHQYLGQLLLAGGKTDEARQAFAAAKSADATSVDPALALAQLDANAGKPEEARKTVQAALAAHPGNLPARLFLAQLEIQARNYPGAAAQYNDLLRENPRDVVILNNLAYSLAESGKYDEAIKYGQQAKELAPDRADVDDTIGWILYRKGVYSSAVQYLKSAAAKNGSALINYHLAMAYLKSGDEKRGNEILKAARAKDPTLPEAKAAQQLIADLASK